MNPTAFAAGGRIRRRLSKALRRVAKDVYDPIQEELKALEERFPGQVPAPTRPLNEVRPWDIALLEHWLYHRAIALGRDATYRDHPWPPRDPDPAWESYWEEVAPYLRPGMTVVEVGPGNGFYTDRYLETCERAYLVDYSELLSFLLLPAKYAEQPKAVPIHSTDCRAPSIPDQSVDLFFSIGTFVHIEIEAHYGYLKEAYRVLKPGGAVVIHFLETCPDDFRAHPIRCHHPESVELLARRVGFQVEKLVVEKTLFSSHIHLRK